MNKSQPIRIDDTNDTLLFQEAEEDALRHPNPQRIGCFDRATLRTFVETPNKLNLKDPKYIHVVQCAECTRQLIEFRRIRDERIQRWRYAVIAASVIAVITLASIQWRSHVTQPTQMASGGDGISATIDLSGDGQARSSEQQPPEPSLSLRQKLISLHVVLPYYSPAGNYRVTVSKERSQGQIEAEGNASATAKGARTELDVKLDLRRSSSGHYYLGTQRLGDGAPYYYPLTLTQ